jgi:hypothetical protein
MDIADQHDPNNEEWLTAAAIGRIIGVPATKVADLASKGLLEVRQGVEALGIRPLYSRASCEALRAKLVRPAKPSALAELFTA